MSTQTGPAEIASDDRDVAAQYLVDALQTADPDDMNGDEVYWSGHTLHPSEGTLEAQPEPEPEPGWKPEGDAVDEAADDVVAAGTDWSHGLRGPPEDDALTADIPAPGRPIIYWDALTTDQQRAIIMADIDEELCRQGSTPCGQTDFDSEIALARADAQRLMDAVCEGDGLFSAVGGKGGAPCVNGTAEDEKDAASTVEDVVTSGEVRAKVHAAVYVAGLAAVATVATAEAALQATSQPEPESEPEPEPEVAGQTPGEVRDWRHHANGVGVLVSLLPVPFTESFVTMMSSQNLQWALGNQEGVLVDEGALVTEAAAQPVLSTWLPDEIPAPSIAVNVERETRSGWKHGAPLAP